MAEHVAPVKGTTCLSLLLRRRPHLQLEAAPFELNSLAPAKDGVGLAALGLYSILPPILEELLRQRVLFDDTRPLGDFGPQVAAVLLLLFLPLRLSLSVFQIRKY